MHNLILSILHSREAQGDPGRYWIAFHGEKTVGVAVQSPLEYPAILTPMEPRAVLAIVDAIAESGVTLPGVNGDAATAASFAGQRSERCKSAAIPFQGARLYELLELREIARSEGQLRQAGLSDMPVSERVRWNSRPEPGFRSPPESDPERWPRPERGLHDASRSQ